MLFRVQWKKPWFRGQDHSAVTIIAKSADRLHIAFEVVLRTPSAAVSPSCPVKIRAMNGDHSAGLRWPLQGFPVQDLINPKIIFDSQLLI